MKSILFSCLILALAANEILCTSKILGVIPERASLYDSSKPFACLDGSNTIPFNQVNDDYCDCRDGSDEPGTAACLNGQFACENFGYIVQMIPSGRVNDGICDCCDGSDETNNPNTNLKCENTCNVLAAEMRAEEERLKVLTDQGLTKKKELIDQGNLLMKSIQDSINDLTANRASLETEKTRLEELKKESESKANEAKSAQDLVFDEQEAEFKKIETAKKALELFRFLDLNADLILSPEELTKNSELDILFDSDGSFTLEEAQNLLDGNDQVTSEVFASIYYEKISPHINRNSKVEETIPSENNNEDGSDDDSENNNEDGNNEDSEHEEETYDEHESTEESTEAPVPTVDRTYNSETQNLINEFEEAKRLFNDADIKFQDADREIKEKESKLAYDIGTEKEFASMIDQCYEFNDREYIYKLCPFSKTVQQSKANNGDTSIGSWAGWAENDETENKYKQMRFTNGLACWNGPQRSTIVHLSCGLENKVISVSEPNKCEYEMKFETPAACATGSSNNGHEEL